MSLSNRVELIPAWLFLVEFTVCLVAASLAALAGPDLPFVLVGLLVLAYALGSYDVLSLTRHQSERAPYQAVSVVAVAYGAYLLVQNRGSSGDILAKLGLAAGCLALFLLLHRWLRNHFLGGVQSITLTVPTELATQARVLEHHLSQSGYPGRVVVAEGIASHRATVAIDNPHWDYSDEPFSMEQTCDLVRFCDVALRVLPPELLELQPAAIGERCESNRFYLAVKRLADLFLSGVAMAVTSPLWLFAVLGILMTNGRPVFYSQFRVGKDGRFIRIIKFRTLRPPLGAGESPTRDFETRAYPFGTFLRRSRIDELPQLLMVFRGTMSIVGPRPEMMFFHRRSSRTIPFYQYRLQAKPGLTGWAQIRYAHSTTDAEYRDKTAYDLWYVAHRNLALDAKIMLRTIGILLNRFGAR